MKRSTKRRLTVPAFAKINLLLRVMGVRADRHHELRTIFQSIALHDTVTIRPARGSFQLACDDASCPADRTNLVWRAAEALWTASGRRGAPRDVQVHLAKRIPMQAGLGGGSSDAAATLVGLAKFWHVDDEPWHAVAASLGADVPYFLEGGTALGLGRGEVLFPLADIPPCWVVLVLPSFGVSTKEAYAWWDERNGEQNRAAHESNRKNGRPAAREILNDLEPPVAARHPAITRIVAALGRHGDRHVAMSGSGSAVFGLFDARRAAERAARALSADRATQPGRGSGPPTVVVTRTVGRSTYRRLVGIPAHRIDLPFAPRGVGRS
jgi:4-diphosphocytidyl-2-C-methyl-D-erythritol kinase